MKTRKCGLWWSSLVFSFTLAPAFSATHYVRPPATCTNTAAQHPFTSWETAATNIQWAVDAAGVAGVVLVSNAHYYLATNVVVTNAVFLRSWNDGAFDAAGTVLDGQNLAACLYIRHTGAVVAGFTVTNGNGGGIATRGANTVAEGCLIENNVTTNMGGGLFCGDTALIFCTTVVNNQATGDNDVHGGGGIAFRNPLQAAVRDCVVAGNSAAGYGGGIFVGTGGVLVERCRVIGNSAGSDGGVRVMNDSTNRPYLFRNMLIAGNQALTNNGGGRLRYGTMMQNCTVAGNTAGVAVGGLTVANVGAVYGASSVSNSICRYNYAAGSEANFSVADGSVVAWTCTSPTSGLTGPGNLALDPAFVDTNTGNYRLCSDSPCLQAGADQEWMYGALDLDRRARLDRITRRVDMGCYEYILRGFLVTFR